MIVTTTRYYEQKALTLIFDDGFQAIHHGLMVWTILDNKADEHSTFDAFSDTPQNKYHQQIMEYARAVYTG